MNQYGAIAFRYIPARVKVRYKRLGHTTSWAVPDFHGHHSIIVPRPVCRTSLYVFLHECSHFRLKHFASANFRKQIDRAAYSGNHMISVAHREYEAEREAMRIMRAEGLAVPLEMIRVAKQYVKECLTEPHYSGNAIDTPAHIKRWANS